MSRDPVPARGLLGALSRAAVAGVLGLALLSPLTAAPAGAAPLAGARQRAAALRGEVDRLTTAAEVATEDYNAAQDRLSGIITAHLLAGRQLTDVRAAAAAEHRVADDRVRALYMTGGPAGLLSTVLSAHDLGDAVARMRAVQSLVGEDRSRVAAGASATDRAAAIETHLTALTAEQVATEKQAAGAADRVRESLAAGRRLLAAADADVVRLAAQERRAAEAAAARAFAARLAAARTAASRIGPLSSVGPSSSPSSSTAAAAVAAAQTRLGSPYVWGATGPAAFDCSGLTGWAYRQAGVNLPRTSRQQWFAGPQVGLADLSPGDLLFWGTAAGQPASIHHVALYIGAGLMIAAPQPGDVVKVQAVYLDGYFGAVRPSG